MFLHILIIYVHVVFQKHVCTITTAPGGALHSHSLIYFLFAWFLWWFFPELSGVPCVCAIGFSVIDIYTCHMKFLEHSPNNQYQQPYLSFHHTVTGGSKCWTHHLQRWRQEICSSSCPIWNYPWRDTVCCWQWSCYPCLRVLWRNWWPWV